jgi:hypothetical protein
MERNGARRNRGREIHEKNGFSKILYVAGKLNCYFIVLYGSGLILRRTKNPSAQNPSVQNPSAQNYCSMYKILSFIIVTGIATLGGGTPGERGGWLNNMQEAKGIARKEHRHILLNFSGSDWCGPCILLRREILDAPAFRQETDSALVLVNADFPRMKKNKLPAAQQQLNEALADQYNPQGKFPFTLLLNADGKVLKSWDGYPAVKPEQFGAEVRAVIDGDK